MIWILAGVAVVLAISAHGAAKAPRLDPYEIVRRYLRVIGPEESLAARKACFVRGNSQVRHVTKGAAVSTGQITFASLGRRLRLILKSDNLAQRPDEITFDGQEIEMGSPYRIDQTDLEYFLDTPFHSEILKRGLLGGALSTAWPLLDLSASKPHLEYGGIKTIEGAEFYQLRLRGERGPGPLAINLYFDTETYHHIYTEYVDADYFGRPTLTPERLEEKFEGFKRVDGLDLPTRWRIRLTTRRSPVHSSFYPVWRSTEWEINITAIVNRSTADERLLL
ncbi:MAG: hypothetical protein ACHQKY_04885 [Terriglobia bacterium]